MITNDYIKASDPKLNIWVSASAGSGKTKSLTDRFLRCLLNGVEPEKILCITFTKVAASEMLSRIRHTLGEWTLLNNDALEKELEILTSHASSEENLNFARGLFSTFIDRQDKLQIQTIHSFCQKLLTRFPLEAGIKMNSTIMTDQERSELIEQARNSFLSNYENELQDCRSVDYLLENIHETTLDSLIEKAIYISDISDFLKDRDLYSEKAMKILDIDLEGLEGALLKSQDLIKEKIEQNIILLSSDVAVNEEIRFIISACVKFITSGVKILDLKQVFLTKEGTPRKSLYSKKNITLYPDLLALLQDIQNMVCEYYDQEISQKTFKLTQGFLDLTYLFNVHFSRIKQKHGSIDYNDLINICVGLLNNNNLSSWIETKLNAKISHIMVDEAQDINLKQWQIIHACASGFFSGENENC